MPRLSSTTFGCVSFFALDILSWHRAVKLAGAGVGTILANTQVFYLGLLGAALYKERLSLRLVLGILLGFIGIAFIANIYGQEGWQELSLDDSFNKGVLWGIVAGVLYAGYIFCIRLARKEFEEDLSAIELLSIVSLFSGVILLAVGFAEGSVALPPSLKNWIYVFLLGGLAQVFG